MTNHRQLLREYSENGSEAAFRELVARYVDLVYSTAVRQVGGDAHLAQDIVQTVFADLARTASKLSQGVMLGGWLHRHTCYVVANVLRAERRRQHRERQAVEMNTLHRDTDAAWQQLAPVLDEAINELGAADRAAIVLRFFDRRDLRSVGEALGTSEDAAQKRVARALEKLRVLLNRRGIGASAAGLAGLLTEKAVQAAPAFVASSLSAALSAGANASAASMLSLSQAFILMAKLKTKTLIVGGIASLILSSAGFFVYRSVREEPATANATSISAALSDVIVNERSRAFRPSAFGVRNGGASELSEDDLNALIASLRALLWEGMDRADNQEIPPGGLLGVIQRFGKHQAAAFAVLREAAGVSIQPVWSKAFDGMGLLDKSVPGLVPFLWETARTGNNFRGSLAVEVLSRLGSLSATDLPALAELLPSLKGNVANHIERVIEQNPDAVKPFISEVEKLLAHEDKETRFFAACALAKSHASKDPRIIEEIAAGLDIARKHSEKLGHGLAALQKAGPLAQPVLPKLLEMLTKWNSKSDSTSLLDQVKSDEDKLRLTISTWMLDQVKPDKDKLRLTISIINPAMIEQMPDVARAVLEDEDRRLWEEKLRSREYTFTELMTALKNPRLALGAAVEMKRMGPAAAEAVPTLFEAIKLAKDGSQKVFLAETIQSIEPRAVLRVGKLTVDNALEAMQESFQPAHRIYLQALNEEMQSTHNFSLDEYAKHYPFPRFDYETLRRNLSEGIILQANGFIWYTRKALAAFSNDLAAQDTSAHRAFVAKLLEHDPSLKEVLEPSPR